MLDTSITYESKKYGKFNIIDYIDARNVIVEFIATSFRTKTQAVHIRSGAVKDKLSPVIYGVGFIGEGARSRNTQKDKSKSKAYTVWSGMLERCYSNKSHVKHPSYKGCTVCDEWHNFQNFAFWFDVNYIKGFDLDKDIKVSGNKIYSPSTCQFVSKRKNRSFSSEKEYLLLSPDGNPTKIKNMKNFCKMNNLHKTSMSSVVTGNLKQHRGWTKI